MRLLRLFIIINVAFRFGLDEFLLGHERVRPLRILVRRLAFWRRLNQPRAVRLRLALEALGPIFVKFGQVLSTRRDLLPADIADELAKLQDRVPPFPSEVVVATLERVYGKPFKDIDDYKALLLADKDHLARNLIQKLMIYGIGRSVELSRLGRGLQAIRDNERAAEAVGVPTLRLKLIATTLSGALMGVAGAPLPFYAGYINPEGAFKDTGSVVNGAALTGCTAPTAVGWSLPSGYPYPKLATSQVRASVLANAGTGRI